MAIPRTAMARPIGLRGHANRVPADPPGSTCRAGNAGRWHRKPCRTSSPRSPPAAGWHGSRHSAGTGPVCRLAWFLQRRLPRFLRQRNRPCLPRSLAMSLFGAMNTAISGLNAQSNAFGNISDNVANSQTTGFKRIDTNFVDYLTTSTATTNNPGAVVARPDYVNDVQGTITQTDNPLALAVTGQGFFAVSQQVGSVNNVPTFSPQQFYSRAGDFQLNDTGYLVNSAGEYLNGWTVDPASGIVNQNLLAPIQVTQT